MHKPDVTVAVLGAGPAALVAARSLAAVGVDVAIVDGGAPAGRHGIESSPASGAPLAAEIGMLELLCSVSDGPAASMHLSWRDATEQRIFEGEGPLLLDREAMHAALRQDAITKGCKLIASRVREVRSNRLGADVLLETGRLTAELVIDARGRVARAHAGDDLVALPFQAMAHENPHKMFLEAQVDGWLWAASTPGDSLHGAVFLASNMLAGTTQETRNGLVVAALSGMRLVSGAQLHQMGRPVAAGFSAADEPVAAARHILIGDAAIARDPIASHGVVHAIRSGVQAAVAACTILDKQTDSRAALAFLRHKHSQTVQAARIATDAAYADQSLHDSAFWRQRRKELVRSAPANTSDVVPVAIELTRAPVLNEDRIRWAPAIALPETSDFFIAHGTIKAVDVAAASRPAASLETIAKRLARSHNIRCVADVIETLCAGGALPQAGVAA